MPNATFPTTSDKQNATGQAMTKLWSHAAGQAGPKPRARKLKKPVISAAIMKLMRAWARRRVFNCAFSVLEDGE